MISLDLHTDASQTETRIQDGLSSRACVFSGAARPGVRGLGAAAASVRIGPLGRISRSPAAAALRSGHAEAEPVPRLLVWGRDALYFLHAIPVCCVPLHFPPLLMSGSDFCRTPDSSSAATSALYFRWNLTINPSAYFLIILGHLAALPVSLTRVFCDARDFCALACQPLLL